ncbi:MAG: PIN domain-containing protein [Gemmataceae bacterium]|nr:PIN domain-containing protein [Planctomycetia bacterium]MBX3399607.1 PIN domain-containing protein [Gemmataceae bacterium]
MTRRFLLDTNAIGHLIYRRFDVPRRAASVRQQGGVIGTCLPVVGELYFGVERSSSRDFSFAAITTGLRAIKIWPFDLPAAKEFGRIAAHLKRSGRPMQVVDVQLAAIAIVLGATVVSTDSDLAAVPGLAVENWSAPASPPAAPTS